MAWCVVEIQLYGQSAASRHEIPEYARIDPARNCMVGSDSLDEAFE